jgi:pSer/pThr/pTyr-binding forkhead associated (FHA) protein
MSDSPNHPSLRIRYSDPDGNQTELILSDKPITIGRSPDADIITLDERASRIHSGIRIWDGEYYVKDLKSKNGTYLNNQKVEMAKIKPGDKIRLGNSILHVDDKKSPGTDTTISSVQDEMDGGKGYKTILREIVENTEKGAPVKPKPAVAKRAEPAAESTEIVSGDGIQLDEEPRTKTAKLLSPSDSQLADSDKKSSKVIRPPAGSGSKMIRLNKSGPSSIKIKRK